MADLDLKLIKDNLEKEWETLVAEFQHENADMPGNDTVNPDPQDLVDISVGRDISLRRIRHLK